MTRRPSTTAMLPLLPLLLLLLQVIRAPLLFVSAQKFEPYELNGGLISAVAARDFIVIASDTRFMGSSGYDIVSRQHITSRLWMAGDDDSSPLLSSIAKTSRSRQQQPTKVVLPKAPTTMTFIGSAGCSTDCEALKRLIQADLRQAVYFGECANHPSSPHPPVDQVANLLSQVLFSRRGFPFYAFCIAAGLHVSEAGGGGRVFVYDAIGSYEEVAVATTGTGRDLLQPILDGKFRTLVAATSTSDDTPSLSASSPALAVINRKRTTTVPTQVDCTEEEAISILIDGYRSVSEREIGVGDNMVLCVVRRKKTKQQSSDVGDGNDSDDCVECSVYSVPLKQH